MEMDFEELQIKLCVLPPLSCRRGAGGEVLKIFFEEIRIKK